jgi:methylmalonyl-CoA/ethylmalonyl-CoA epimerase
MLTHIEHIGIAVNDLKKSTELFTKLLGIKPYKTEIVDSEGVETVFFQIGQTKIELLGSINGNSAIAKFIEKNGEGIHHIAFATDNIQKELQRLCEASFQLIHTEPKLGADNKQIAFIHPKSTNKVLVELCMDNHF